VVADHAVTTYDGDLDDYRRMVLSARGMRPTRRDRAAMSASSPRQAVRNKSEKRVPLKQKFLTPRPKSRPHQRYQLSRTRVLATAGILPRRAAGSASASAARRPRCGPAARRTKSAGASASRRSGEMMPLMRAISASASRNLLLQRHAFFAFVRNRLVAGCSALIAARSRELARMPRADNNHAPVIVKVAVIGS